MHRMMPRPTRASGTLVVAARATRRVSEGDRGDRGPDHGFPRSAGTACRQDHGLEDGSSTPPGGVRNGSVTRPPADVAGSRERRVRSLPFSLSAAPSPAADHYVGRRRDEQRRGRPGPRPHPRRPVRAPVGPVPGRSDRRARPGRRRSRPAPLPHHRGPRGLACAPDRCGRSRRRRPPVPRRTGPSGRPFRCDPRPSPSRWAPSASLVRRIALWGAGPDGEYLAWRCAPVTRGSPPRSRPAGWRSGAPATEGEYLAWGRPAVRLTAQQANPPVVLREMPSTPTIPSATRPRPPRRLGRRRLPPPPRAVPRPAPTVTRCSPPGPSSPAPSAWSPPPTGWPPRPAWRPSRPAATRSTPPSPPGWPSRSSSRTSTAPAERSPSSSRPGAGSGQGAGPGGAGGSVVLSGQGVAPAAATIEAFEQFGLDLVPGTGLLAATVPGAFGAWLTLLRDHGTQPLDAVLRYAIEYAENGHPLLPRVTATVASVSEHFRTHWPTSAATWLSSDGAPPAAGRLFRNRVLASTYRRLLDAARGPSREAQIDAALSAWYSGFVAEEIDRFARYPVMDDSGRPHPGFLTGQDLAGWTPTYEAPVTLDRNGWTLAKAGPWSQGPALLQAIAMLDDVPTGRRRDRFASVSEDADTAEVVHASVEATKLAMADREAWYGDVENVPVDDLLSSTYAAERRALIGDTASNALRPGSPGGRPPRLPAFIASGASLAAGSRSGAGIGEPTVDPHGTTRGDTCHVDVVDRWGNLVSATPSGGWLQSSPVIPALGFPLGTRAQMFWLERGLPNSLAPGKRPRTTLTPSLALRGGVPTLAFGTPGRRPAGAVAAVLLAAARPRGTGPAGGDRRAGLAHHRVPVVVLPARVDGGRGRGRVAARGRRRRRAPPPRARRHRLRAVDPRPAVGGEPGPRDRDPPRRGQRARHAGLRRRPLTRRRTPLRGGPVAPGMLGRPCVPDCPTWKGTVRERARAPWDPDLGSRNGRAGPRPGDRPAARRARRGRGRDRQLRLGPGHRPAELGRAAPDDLRLRPRRLRPDDRGILGAVAPGRPRAGVRGAAERRSRPAASTSRSSGSSSRTGRCAGCRAADGR